MRKLFHPVKKDGNNMENILVTSIMLALCIFSKDKRLLILIAVGSLSAIAIDYIDDIAVFYSINSLVAILLSYVSVKYIKGDSAKVYAILMFIQSLLCFLLIFDHATTSNYMLQLILQLFNAGICYIIIILGFSYSELFFSRKYCLFSSRANRDRWFDNDN